MSKTRKKIYRQGDRITVLIPKDASPELLKWINQQKKLSPAITDLLELQVKKIKNALDE